MDVLDRLRMDVPVAQAGMGGGLAGAELATAVANAGGLGTLGLLPPDRLGQAIRQVRDGAPGRAVAVNFLGPFVRRRHILVCAEAGVDAAVFAFGGDPEMVRYLKQRGVFVFAMVGSDEQVRRAVGWDVDALIAQGVESGGHLSGDEPVTSFLPRALALADGRPVFAAGGIATAADTQRALAAGADGVVAGTRFLLTDESGAHPEYQRRLVGAENTYRTTLFGFGWPAPHRVVANAATRRWCRHDGTAKLPARLVDAPSSAAAVLGDVSPEALVRFQTPRLPVFTPAAPTRQMPQSWVDRTALYAGESVLRMSSVIPAREAVAELAGR